MHSLLYITDHDEGFYFSDFWTIEQRLTLTFLTQPKDN